MYAAGPEWKIIGLINGLIKLFRPIIICLAISKNIYNVPRIGRISIMRAWKKSLKLIVTVLDASPTKDPSSRSTCSIKSKFIIKNIGVNSTERK